MLAWTLQVHLHCYISPDRPATTDWLAATDLPYMLFDGLSVLTHLFIGALCTKSAVRKNKSIRHVRNLTECQPWCLPYFNCSVLFCQTGRHVFCQTGRQICRENQ